MKKCCPLLAWIKYTVEIQTTVSRSSYVSISLPLECICGKLIEKICPDQGKEVRPSGSDLVVSYVRVYLHPLLEIDKPKSGLRALK